MINDDVSAWNEYPEQRLFFNKLWVLDLLGVECGPACVDVPRPGEYCVRPIYNLYGMGKNAKKHKLTKWTSHLPAGSFWTPWVTGDHVTVDYENNGTHWKPIHAYCGVKEDKEETNVFIRWDRVDPIEAPIGLTTLLNSKIDVINLEYIGGTPIEVHLRGNPDPVEYKCFVPDWEHQNNKNKYKDFDYIKDPVTVGGHKRLGFFVKGKL